MPPTVCQSTRASSARALRHMCSASHATQSSKAEANLLEAHLAQGTGAVRTPCSGQLALTGACSR